MFKDSKDELPEKVNESYLCWILTHLGPFPNILIYRGDGYFQIRPKWNEKPENMKGFHIDECTILWVEIPCFTSKKPKPQGIVSLSATEVKTMINFFGDYPAGLEKKQIHKPTIRLINKLGKALKAARSK